MANVNTVTLSGNLTRDPETREVGDTSVTSLRLAVNGRRKDGDEWVDVPNYFDVSVWGRYGEVVAKYAGRGSHVTVEGALRWREWEADGGKRQAVDVVARSVDLGGGTRNESSADDADDDPGF